MADNIDALIAEHWAPMLQDFLNNRLVARPLARTAFGVDWSFGDKVHFDTVSSPYVQTYTPGTELTIADTDATDDSLTISTRKAATFKIDKTQYKQVTPKYLAELAAQSSYVIQNNIDQALITTGVNGAAYTVAGGALSSSTMYSTLTSCYARLERANANDIKPYFLITPDHAALLTQGFVANGFQRADQALADGFRSIGEAANFQIFVTNNLPHSVGLTVDTNATAGDTVTVYGVTFTFVANGTAANAGEISLGTGGSALADTQANLRAAINGTGTPGASTYIELSKENRRILQNAQVSASAFASNVSTITAFGRIQGTETFTAGTNVFGTETCSMLCGRPQNVSLGIQIDAEMHIAPEPKMPITNYMNLCLFGTEMFDRDTKRAVKLTASY